MPVKVLGALHICDSLQKNDSKRQKRVANRRGGVVVNGTKHNFLDDEKEAMIMTGLISIWGGRGRPVRTHKREGGGDDLSVRSLGGPASGLATIGVLLAGLGILAAVPHPAAAQGMCAGTDGTPPKLTLSSTATTTKIECNGLDQGLELDLNGAQITTTGSDTTLSIDAEGDGDKDIKVMGDITIISGDRGIYMVRDGAGLLELNLGEKSRITSSGNDRAIYLQHKGKAVSGAGVKTEGINIVSSAEIDISGADVLGKTGIWATTDGAPADAIVPITIHLTGGYIYATSVSSDPKKSNQGKGVLADQRATGDITITVEPGVNIGTADKFLDTYGIEAYVADTGTSSITIKHMGKIYATQGIKAHQLKPAKGRTDVGGNVLIETGAKSEIVTRYLDTRDDTQTNAGADAYGIQVRIDEARTGDVTIIHRGTINAAGHGIYTYGSEDVTVTLEKGSSITSKEKGIDASFDGKVTITHRGTINAAGEGINASGAGGVTVTLEKGSLITSTGNDGVYGLISSSAGKGDIKINHHGKIVADQRGIFIGNFGTGSVEVMTEADSSITASGAGTYKSGINASVRGGSEGTVRINHKGTITADHEGIDATNRVATGTGSVMVKTAKGSTITADRSGIRVRHDGTGLFDVQIHGMVLGDSKYTSGTEYAGVRVQGRTGGVANDDATWGKGGTIRIGPWGHVSSKPKDKPVDTKIAIQVDAYAGPVTIILEEDEAGVVGHVEGQILNPAAAGDSAGTTRSTLEFKTRSVSGSEKVLDAPGAIIYRRGQRTSVYAEVIKAKLEKLTGGKEGYRFVDDTTMKLRLYSHRSRLYEVLPSVLLGLVDLTPYSTRMAVPRQSTGEEVVLESSKGEHVATPGSRTGVWVRLAVRDGERMADTSTTATDFWRQSLAWDVKQTDFEAGLEVPTDERLVLGVSAHYRQSEATVKRGGTMEASGTGVGVSLTWTDDSGLYVDGQLSYTRFFDITMVSANGAVGSITSTGGGSGLAVGVEVGQPVTIGGMTVIPRGGLSWSSVDMDAFDEPARIDGAGRVTPDKEQSVQGRVGVLAELGSKDADGRLYASLDLEHEFSSKHAVMVAGTRLATEVQPTWVRLGVGGAMSLGGHDTTMLTGDAFYATAGSDNTDFGGGLSVTFRF